MIRTTTKSKTAALMFALVCVMLGGSLYENTTAVPISADVDGVVCDGPVASHFCTVWTARYDGPVSGNDIAHAIDVDPDGHRVYVTGNSKISSDSNAGFATIAYDSQTGGELWVAMFNPGQWGLDIPHAIVVSPDGDTVYVTGGSRDAINNPDRHYATVAYNATDGTQLWVAGYDGPGNGHDIPHAIGMSQDGTRIFVTGESPGDGTFMDFATIAYDTDNGSELWVARYDGPLSANEIGSALGVTPDGSTVFVTGRSAEPGSSLDYTTIAYDAASGTVQWLVTYDGPANGVDVATDLIVSADGKHVYVTGHSTGLGTGADYATIKYNATNGDPVWVARYDGPANGYETAAAIELTPDGSRLIVTGHSDGAGTGKDYATVALDATTGDTDWAVRYNGDGNGRDRARALGVSPDGTQIFVTGDSYREGTDYGDSLTVAYDAVNGTEIWTARAYELLGLSELGYLAYDASTALVVHPEENLVYVTGHAWSEADKSGYNWQTIAYGTVTPPSMTFPPNPPNLPLPHIPIPEPPEV